MEAARLALLDQRPRARQEAHRQTCVAIGELAVGTEGEGEVPLLGQAAGGPAGEAGADLALAAQRLVARSLVGALQRLVDDARKRNDEARVGLVGEYQRKVVAQRGEVTVAGEQRRPEREALHGVELPGAPHAGEVEGKLGVQLGVHVCGQMVNLSSSASSPARMSSTVRGLALRRRSS